MDNKNISIKLKEYLNNEDYKEVKNLQMICNSYDKTELKLELDYKLNISAQNSKSINNINEYMYYDRCNLIGYLGICNFGGYSYELNGMVHPNYRRQGIFTKLFQVSKHELAYRNAKQILLLTDSTSQSGEKFIKTTKATYEHSEYEMYLNNDLNIIAGNESTNDIILIKATNRDAKKIAYQNSIYFNSEYDESDMIMPEEEEKRGMTIYLVKANNKVIGKVHLQIENSLGSIYGLGVLPEYRSKGYGRKIILKAIDSLKTVQMKKIMLQVSINNSNALNLYKSCGFEETSIMDYYQL